MPADLVVIDGEPGTEDDLIEAVEGGAAEAVLFREGGERSGGGEGRYTEDDLVLRVDVAGERELAAIGGPGFIREIEVAAAGDFVGEEVAAGEAEFRHHAIAQAAVKVVDRRFAGWRIAGP